MKYSMKALFAAAGALALGFGLGAPVTPAKAEGKTIALCWAAWDPANALVELSKDFTAKTGVGMKFEFVPWTNYADRFLNELNSHGSLCDLIIGDSQWIGGAAENGQYVKLNDFFKKEGISMDDYMPATVVGYSQWPKNTPNYWADRKSTRLNSSHGYISYAVFCLQKKTQKMLSLRESDTNQLLESLHAAHIPPPCAVVIFGASCYVAMRTLKP